MRTNVRVTGIVVRDEKLLLIHRFRYGSEYWAIPGGGVEEGEDLDTALKREMLEETGQNLVSYNWLFDQHEEIKICNFYSCELEDGKLTLGGPELEKQSASNQYHFEWVEINDLPGMVIHHMSPRLLGWLNTKRTTIPDVD